MRALRSALSARAATVLLAGSILVHAQLTSVRAEELRSQPAPSLLQRLETVSRILEQQRLLADPDKTTDVIVRAWLESIDPLAAWWTPEEAAHILAAENGQVYEPGLRLAVSNGAIVVAAVPANANLADLQAGARLVAVDQAPTAGETVERVASWLQLTTNRPLILTVMHGTNDERNISIPVQPARKTAIASTEELPTGLAYIKFNGFYPGSESEILSTVRRWTGQTKIYGMIFDLRQAAGRDAQAAAAVASLFTAEGRVLATIRGANDREIALFRAQPSFKASLPVMILTDESTRGAAEWFAAVVKGLGRGAMLIGSETRGDPLVRESVELPWSRVLYLATRQLVVADGTRYTGQEKVIPHILARPTDEMPYEPSLTADAVSKMTDEERVDRNLRLRIGNDTVLRRAVELLRALKALNVGPRTEH